MIVLTLNSTIDNLPLSVMISKPENAQPKGIIQIAHGMREHKERYIPFIEYLSSNGYICVIHDHRGHGKSVLSESDLGYFYDAGYRGMIEDVHQVTRMIKDMYPSLSLSLLGHSMGSMVVRCYAKKYDYELDHLIVCGSPSYVITSKIGILLAQIVGKCKGAHYRSKTILNLVEGKFNLHFNDATSSKSWLSSDHEIADLHNANPKSNYKFTANGYENLFKLMNDSYSRKGWSVSRPDLPIYFIAGENDPCIIDPARFQKAINVMVQVGYKNIRSKLHPQMRHEILNGKNKERVWKDILNFLNLS